MLDARTIACELQRAALVLALVFLTFAHTAVGTGSGAHDATLAAGLDSSWCGDAPIDGNKAHAPCHACRLGAGADLPPQCIIAVPLRATADVHYGALPVLSLPAIPLAAFLARGPPIA